MRKTRHLSFILLATLALVGSACAGDDGDVTAGDNATTTTPGPSLSITSPANDAHVKGNVVTLALNVGGIKIVAADGDTSGATGHLHVFIDKEPVAVGAVIPKEAGVIHSVDNPLVVPGLSVGDHTLSVVVGDGTHKRLDVDAAKVSVHVDGPTLDATAPATLAAGSDLSIDVAVTGVTLVKADGDASGATGHLHAFVDKPPVAPGELIPAGDPAIIHSATAPIVVKGLAAGEHTIWIVLGDGTHTAFKDSVRDKVTVTVT
ncbi:MAG: hypothetical protein QOF21_1574 [Actinomycetota bacterium]|jgi:uncharacterized protein (DUF736 family)